MTRGDRGRGDAWFGAGSEDDGMVLGAVLLWGVYAGVVAAVGWLA